MLSVVCPHLGDLFCNPHFESRMGPDVPPAECTDKAERPEAIVLDWMMPELDGIEVVVRLRADGDETPILMLTARDAIEDRVERLQGGADDYLVKPFAPAELVARLQALLRRSSAAKMEKPLSFADLHLDPVTRVTERGKGELMGRRP